MAVTPILPQRVDPAALRPLAALLTSTHAADPCFARALDRALGYAEAGAAYEPFNATHYRIQSHSQPTLWRYVTLDACSCETRALWCWHRALVNMTRQVVTAGRLLDLEVIDHLVIGRCCWTSLRERKLGFEGAA